MKPRIEVMVDLETLGHDTNTPIIMIAWIVFSFENTDLLQRKIYVKHDRAEINLETLQWWLKTDASLLKDILDNGEMNERDALTQFVESIMELKETYDVQLWGNGILFDNAIIQGKCQRYGLTYPIDYDKDRDVRTLVDMYITKYGVTKAFLKELFKPTREHDAMDDCIAQINMVKHLYGGLTKND